MEGGMEGGSGDGDGGGGDGWGRAEAEAARFLRMGGRLGWMSFPFVGAGLGLGLGLGFLMGGCEGARWRGGGREEDWR